MTKAGALDLVAAVLALTLSTAAPAAGASDPKDFDGTWMMTGGNLFLGLQPYTPAGQNLMSDRLRLVKEGRTMANPHLTCRPTGIAGEVASKSPLLVLTTPQKIYVVTQEDREVRYINLQRGHPANLAPSYGGDSVAHWEGDTLVVDVTGFNGKGQLDEFGNPQSAQSHVVERWSKSADGNTLTVAYTMTDPVYYTKPVEVTRTFRRLPGARVADYDCAENPRADDFSNLTFTNDWFKPVCTRPIVNGVAADKVVCNMPKKAP